MNYYLTPQEIAEALGLTEIRKSTPGGLFLLSESDLVSYGIERAKEAGAIELSNNRHVTPAQEPAEEQENEQQPRDNSAEEPAQEGEVTQEENEETETGNEENPDPEDDGSAAGDEEQEDNNNENTEEE